MYYTVTPADYPSNSVQSKPFAVVIAEPCVPISLTPPTLSGITISYTITAPELIFKVNAFIVDPPECEIIITVEVTPPLLPDSPIKILTPTELRVYKDNNLDGTGSYSIKILARTSTLTESAAYGLNINNPCKDRNFVSIDSPDPVSKNEALQYTITAGSQSMPIEYNVGTFDPIDPYQLCG